MNVKSEKLFVKPLYGIDILPACAAWNRAFAELQKRAAAICVFVYMCCVVASLAVQWYDKARLLFKA